MSENEKNVPERRFKEFENADAWEQRKLGELATMKARIGWQGLTQKEFLDEGDYYLITGTDFKNGQIDFTNCHYINKERYSQDANIQVKNGDVLITKDGTIGKVAYIRDMKKPATLNAGVFVVKGKDKNISNLYLYHYLAAPFLLEYADKQATGGTIKHLNQNVLVNFPIPIPKFEEQQRIGDYFQNIDNLITLHRRKLEKMKALKKAYLTEMFPAEGQRKPKLRFAGFTDNWEQRELGEVADLLTGYAFESKSFTEDGIPLVRGMNIKRGYLDMSENICEYWPSSRGLESYLLMENDILIQMDGALIGKSYAKIHSKNLPALLVQRVTRVRSEKVNCEFIYQCIQRNFLNYILGIKTETAVPHLSINDIRNYQIAIPSATEQTKIVIHFNNLDNLITLHQHKLDKLQNIKKAYLNEMFI